MLSGIRTILYQTTLKWPPFQDYVVGKGVIRSLFNKMHDPGGYHYQNLDLQAEPPTMSTRRQTGHSVCKFGADYLAIEEKKPELAIEGFIEAVLIVLGGLNQDDVPPFFMQECKLQCLAQPANVSNSLELLAKNVANVYESIEPFQRPPHQFGVRFRFPPVVIESVTPAPSSEGDSEVVEADANSKVQLADPATIGEGAKTLGSYVTARFETFAEDMSLVWMEVTASYPQLERPLRLTDKSRIAENIRETHMFLTDKCKRFLDQFDIAATDDTTSGTEGS